VHEHWTNPQIKQLQNRWTKETRFSSLCGTVTGSMTYAFVLGTGRSGALNIRPSVGPLSTFINDTSNISTQVRPPRTPSVTIRATKLRKIDEYKAISVVSNNNSGL